MWGWLKGRSKIQASVKTFLGAFAYEKHPFSGECEYVYATSGSVLSCLFDHRHQRTKCPCLWPGFDSRCAHTL